MLDAYSYFLKQTPGAKKAELRYNAFGFNIGGPVEFRSSNPKTFFFYNQEWRREINGGAIHKLVPTAKMFGFGSGTTVSNNPDMTGEGTIYVPQTTDPVQLAKFSALGLTPGQPFPNNQIPLSLVDPTAKAYLAAGYMLPPNDASGRYYNSSANTSTFYREEIARVDHQFTKKFTVFGHLIYDSLSQAAPSCRLDRQHISDDRFACEKCSFVAGSCARNLPDSPQPAERSGLQRERQQHPDYQHWLVAHPKRIYDDSALQFQHHQ